MYYSRSLLSCVNIIYTHVLSVKRIPENRATFSSATSEWRQLLVWHGITEIDDIGRAGNAHSSIWCTTWRSPDPLQVYQVSRVDPRRRAWALCYRREEAPQVRQHRRGTTCRPFGRRTRGGRLCFRTSCVGCFSLCAMAGMSYLPTRVSYAESTCPRHTITL